MTPCHSETRRKQRRVHGLQMPWHPQQVAGWLVLAMFGACSFGVLLPGLGPDVYPVALFVLGSLFFLHVVSHVAALLIDPADPQLRALRDDGVSSRKPVPELDKTKHAHVIENGKCHLCNIYTSGHRTKHCGSCNKCVEKFDHHCKWLNHCIGARNYVAFIVSVVSAVLACLVIVLVSSAELVIYNADPLNVEHYLQPVFGSNQTIQVNQLFSVSRLPVDRNVFVAIASAQCVLALVAMVLLLHLCVFHVYISALGITTYEYIRNYRRYPEFDSRNGAAALSSSSSMSNNNVAMSSGSCKNAAGRKSAMARLYSSACCYGAVTTGRRKRPSCGIHSNLNGTSRNDSDGAAHDDMTVETVESYGRNSGASRLLNPKDMDRTARPEDREQQNTQPKCRYCLEKNRIRGDGARFFVLGKRRKGFCCCFQKPEPVFGRTAVAAAAAAHHVKVPPSPFAVRRNRVIPTDGGQLSLVVDEWKSFNSSTLPALPHAAGHRQMQKITLKELGQVLAFVEQQPSKAKRRKIGGGNGQIKHSKSSSNLSPIHESGLSNPSTPQLKNRYPQTRPCSWLSSTSSPPPPTSSSSPHNTSKSA
uniref:Palmitoyltransferase n=1 Tax=Schizaphis graminum TaxID=13262 RepID=A0A2S2NH20_SCHGA